MEESKKDIIRVWMYLVLIIICAFFLIGQIKYIQDFSSNERDMISKSSFGENVKIILPDYEVAQITKTDITNLLITVINVNILILCITILLIDILRIAKNE